MTPAKYRIGDRVFVYIQRGNLVLSWEGTVSRVNDVSEDDLPMFEYLVSGAPSISPGQPLLAWESELIFIK